MLSSPPMCLQGVLNLAFSFTSQITSSIIVCLSLLGMIWQKSCHISFLLPPALIGVPVTIVICTLEIVRRPCLYK
jgi:hypothetical protein